MTLTLNISVNSLSKGDGNDGEPDTRHKLEFEKKAKYWLEFENSWMVWDDI